MSVQLQVKLDEFTRSMTRYRDELGIAAPQVFKDQMRLLTKELQAQTWPKTQKQGTTAVERDIKRAVKPLDANAFNSISDPRLKKRLQQVARQKNTTALKSILSHTKGPLSHAVIVPFDQDLHRKQRNARGRITKNLGRITLDTQKLVDYIKLVKSRVGWARAGWNAAAEKLGGTLASWVKRHGNNGGAARGNPNDQTFPDITMINDAVEIPGYAAQVERALVMRERNMTRDLEERLKRAGRSAGFKT